MVLLLVACTRLLGAVEVDHVLVLHSYNTDYQWTREMDEGIRNAFALRDAAAIIAHAEYLDARHFDSPEHLADRVVGLAAKYASTPLDGIIVTDDVAFDLMREHRDRLFGPVPLVFAGINGFSPQLIEGLSAVTGIVEAISVTETLEFISGTFGASIRLYILTDSTTTGTRNLEWVLRELNSGPVGLRPEVRIRRDATPEDLRRINAEEARSRDPAVALLIGSVSELDGSPMPFDRAARVIPEILQQVPVVTMWDFYLGRGIMGGKLTRAGVQGAMAGRMMLDVLSGTPPDRIPIVSDSPNEWVFDATAVRRHELMPGQLPRGSILINHQPSIWDLYRSELIAATVAFLSLVSVLAVLLVSMRRRAETDKRLRESLAEKEVLLHEIHHRVKNNLQVISSILNMQSATVSDPDVVTLFLECESRVRTMALVHEQFYESQSLNHISMKDYLEELVDSVAALMGAPGVEVRVLRHFDDLELNLVTAIPVGLLLNELVSNAFKHGMRGPNLELSVSLTLGGSSSPAARLARLVVADRGPGMAAPPDVTKTLGLALVSTLAAQIGGSVAFSDNDPSGLRVEIEFPMPDGSRTVA